MAIKWLLRCATRGGLVNIRPDIKFKITQQITAILLVQLRQKPSMVYACTASDRYHIWVLHFSWTRIQKSVYFVSLLFVFLTSSSLFSYTALFPGAYWTSHNAGEKTMAMCYPEGHILSWTRTNYCNSVTINVHVRAVKAFTDGRFLYVCIIFL